MALLLVLLKEGIAVNSTASIDYTDVSNPKVLGNPTEGALLLWLNDQTGFLSRVEGDGTGC